MKLTVFTAVIGTQTDPLRPVQHPVPGVQYLCFTDQPLTVAGWTIRQVPAALDPVVAARELKIRADATLKAEDPDVSLWMDAAYELKVDPRTVATQVWRADVAAFAHPDRTTIEQEGWALVRLGLVARPLIEAQMALCRATGFLPRHSLTSTGFLLRRHCARVQTFNAAWWGLFSEGGHTRDQMTMDWAAALMNVDVHHLPGHYRDNAYARWHKHRTVDGHAAHAHL
jgi:alkaline ceramidase TOD1/glycosyltransferase MUCI70-like protein